MFPDFKELLRSFHAHGVKYLIVGGYAVSFQAQPRATNVAYRYSFIILAQVGQSWAFQASQM